MLISHQLGGGSFPYFDVFNSVTSIDMILIIFLQDQGQGDFQGQWQGEGILCVIKIVNVIFLEGKVEILVKYDISCLRGSFGFILRTFACKVNSRRNKYSFLFEL